ncbi:helix-turn-helix domain-containing protein [Microbacterium faecale]|nr:helix-turn-helix domain-containing protein [Microbacterium faecale]
MTMLMSMREGKSAFRSGLPEEFVDIIRADVRHGIPLDALMNRVWSVHSMAKDILVESLREVVEPTEFPQVMRSVGDAAFDFANDFVRHVSTAYDAEQRAWRGRRGEEQFQIAEAVALGSDAASDSDGVLPAHWSGWHVYAVSWIEDPGFAKKYDTELAEFTAAVATMLDASNVFIFERDGFTHLWWNVEARASKPEVQAILGVERPDWLRLAVGPAARGVEGFRDTYGAAVQVADIRAYNTVDTVFFSDEVGHLLLMLADHGRAARFVRRELGGLASTEPRVVEIRETVRLYLSSGNSRLAVANALHLAPNTIAYRVGQANELLPQPVSERPTTILLALQLLYLVPNLIAEAGE